MADQLTFDWVVLAPIAEVAARVEAVCDAQTMGQIWYASTPDGLPVQGCRITSAQSGTVAVLTLQGYYPDQTHLRLQQDADQAATIALADALYLAMRRAGWMPVGSPLLEHTPRFVRPQGFRPRPGVVEARD